MGAFGCFLGLPSSSIFFVWVWFLRFSYGYSWATPLWKLFFPRC